MGFLDTLSSLMNFDKPQATKAVAPTQHAKPKSTVAPVKKVETKKKLPTHVVVKHSALKHSAPTSKKTVPAIKKTVALQKPTISPYVRSSISLMPEKKKQMVCAPGEHCFWVCDGRVLADLRELGAALAEIEDEIFTHHVTDERHDFANWVEEILCDGDCAKKLRETDNRHDARKVVLQALDLYE